MIKRLGEILIEHKLVSTDDVGQALVAQAEIGGMLGENLVRGGALSEDNLINVLSHQLQIGVLVEADVPRNADQIARAMNALNLSAGWLRAQNAIVFFGEVDDPDQTLTVACLHPFKLEIRERIDQSLVRMKDRPFVRFLLASRIQLEQLQASLLDDDPVAGGDADLTMQRLKEMAQEAPVIDFVSRLFETSLKRNASDIHIEPYEHEFEIRVRIDGILSTLSTHPRMKFNAISSRIKLLSGMDIAEQRLPQDGRQSIRMGGENLDLRVSSLPGTWGESLVLRLLRKEQSLPDLEGLGLSGQPKQALEIARNNRNGVILITGPTGSGKSTTLYRTLEDLNDGLRKIITVEDPVEYNMANITQVQIRSEIGYTFARGLRAILRHDPDIVMVGEIRDGETAEIAARAALTGHLVFSTLHTNSALEAINRLLNLGLEPFLIASSVRALAAQRLVRRLCPHCATPANSDVGEQLIDQVITNGAIPEHVRPGMASWREAVGCKECDGIGYSGRLGLFEVALVDDAISMAIANRKNVSEILALARRNGFHTLLEDGLSKARAGLTSLDEVLRVVGNSVEVHG